MCNSYIDLVSVLYLKVLEFANLLYIHRTPSVDTLDLTLFLYRCSVRRNFTINALLLSVL